MSEQMVIEFLMSFVAGAGVCFAKEYLMQRYFLNGNALISSFLFFGRFVIDLGMMLLAIRISLAALLGVALGLTLYVNWMLLKAVREQYSFHRKR